MRMNSKLKNRFLGVITIVILAFISNSLFAQVGEVIWEEQFDNLDNWAAEIGNGAWGHGNGELQFYKPDNIDISEIPGEPGNNALVIFAQEETGSDIVDQWGNPLSYTSGRVNTRSLVSVKYGVIETRIQVPDLNLGGWPAFWLQGTSNLGWPKNGELDMMEMGHTQEFRDALDAYNGGNNLNNSTVNMCTGANAIFYSDGAVNDQNPSGAASIAWDRNYTRPYFNHDDPLNDRFVIYRMYWDDSSIRFTIIDEGIEHDLYTGPFPISDDSDEFRQPFYFIINLAVGGTFTDAYNLGDPNSGEPISMPFPAEMLVDYIKVMKWNGKGEVTIGSSGTTADAFALFSDDTPAEERLVFGQSAEIYVWENTLTGGSIDPFEGENVISWKTTGKGWFGAGIWSTQPLDLSNFSDGYLKLKIKIPANVTFKIGINDTWSNEHYVEFPANQTKYGLVRDGEWGQAIIPVTELRGTLIDMSSLAYVLTILEQNGASCEFALDDIYYTNTLTSVKTQSPVATEFKLEQNYPNPFNPQTTISYTLHQNANVELTIFDLNGHVIETLVHDSQNAGRHSIQWNASNIASGVYFYKLTAGNFSQMRKMLLVR